jgi:hypothetical protein
VHLAAQLRRDQVRQRGLAQARHARKKNMVKRLAALFGGLNVNAQVFNDVALPDELRKTLRPQRQLELPLGRISRALVNGIRHSAKLGAARAQRQRALRVEKSRCASGPLPFQTSV